MTLRIRRILVVVKVIPAHGVLSAKSPFVRRDLARIRRATRVHTAALRQVLAVLQKKRVPFRVVRRVGRRNWSSYDLVVSVGGDGTFLEAARGVDRQRILGVNSNPSRSAGSFCTAMASSFEPILNRILQGREQTVLLNRLQMIQNRRRIELKVLNDLLITHRRPAAMSRYWLQRGPRAEEQRSSGLWIATAAGSTGAIRSAGGRLLKRASRQIQYRPRELYAADQKKVRLKGGILRAGSGFQVGSLMKQGMICVDGDHITLPFRYGDVLEIHNSPDPLRWVVG